MHNTRQSTSPSAVTGNELTSLQQQQKKQQQSKGQPKVFVRGSSSSDKQPIRLQQNKAKSSRL